MAEYAFEDTKLSIEQFTDLFDFVWPTAAALWNLRWQIEGFKQAVPTATDELITKRFIEGSGIRGAGNHKNMMARSWEDQQEIFAGFVLTNAFAIYEGWAYKIVQTTKPLNIMDKHLSLIATDKQKGLLSFISAVNEASSQVMTDAFFSSFKKNKSYHPDILKNMQICFRYFKNIRNCQIHKGGIADKAAESSYTEFSTVCSSSSLHTKEELQHEPIVFGQKVKLKLRGVVGFCEILIRLMVTTDVLISGSKAAESEALRRLNQNIRHPMRTLSLRNPDRIILATCKRAGLPKPSDMKIIKDFLITNKIVN